jgi:hypothetical protein
LRWSISADSDPQNDHYSIEVPELKLTLGGRLSELTTRSGFASIRPGLGIGCLKINETTLLEAERILGTPIRTDVVDNNSPRNPRKATITYFPVGLGVVAEDASSKVTAVIAFAPYRGTMRDSDDLSIGEKLPETFQSLKPRTTPNNHVLDIPGAIIRLTKDRTVQSVLVYRQANGMVKHSIEPLYEPQQLNTILRE